METFEVRDMRHKEKFFVDDAYLNGYAKYLGTTNSMIYFILCRHADKNQECFPSYEFIASRLGVSEATIKRGVKELRNWNIISIGKRKRKGGQFLHNSYVLLDKSVWKSKPEVTEKVPIRCLFCDSITLDRCHIIPKRDGGRFTKENIVLLCPTHHRQFDNNLLSDEQIEIINHRSPMTHGEIVSLKSKPEVMDAPDQRSPMHSTTGHPRPDKDTHNKDTHNKEAETSSAGVISIIDEFRKWTPVAKRWYANKTQRQACEDLIESYGLEQILKVIPLLEKTNKLDYIPSARTPLQLFEKYLAIKDGLGKMKSKKLEKKNNYY